MTDFHRPKDWEFGWLGALRGLLITFGFMLSIITLLLLHAQWYLAQQ
jgi:hypothetical protein